MTIPMARPSTGAAELKQIKEVFKSGWLGEGHITEMFEKALGEFTGARHVVAVNTGTSALHLALHGLGVGPGDEVILPSMTFVSDPQAVLMCGAQPVFCDIDENTLNVTPETIKKHLTAKTRAIIPTDFAGLPCDVRAIRRAVGHPGIKIIRDASHSFGSRINGKILGIRSGEDATCFSFDPIKNLTCGEGGAILVKNATMASRLRSQKMLGIIRSTWYSFSKKKVEDRRVVQQGFRYHMSNINAAIGLAQLQQFESFATQRKKLAALYDDLLQGHPGIKLFKRDYEAIVPFMYIIRVAPHNRDNLINFLVANDAHAGLRYFPCHLQPFFEHSGASLPATEHVAQEMLSIPLYHGMRTSQARRIAALIKKFFN